MIGSFGTSHRCEPFQMKPLDTRRRFLEHLASQALDPESLDPWSGWRAFKDFLRMEVEDVYDAAAIQFQVEDERPSMFLVRQFTQRATDAEDVLLGRLIVEFQYDKGECQEQEIWTLDFPSLEEWASVVEGEPTFQALVNLAPKATEVYYDTGPD